LVRRLALSINVIYAALLLYYVLKKPNIPLKTKGIILGALGYFIVPTDAIPDLIPVVGYSDDLGALVLALAQVSMHVDDDVKSKARRKLTDWFGDFDGSELKDIDDKF